MDLNTIGWHRVGQGTCPHVPNALSSTQLFDSMGKEKPKA